MREEPILITGVKVYIFFDDFLRKKMRLKYRLKNRYIVEYEIKRVKNGNVILLQSEPICGKDEPYGGCGLALPCGDTRIISLYDYKFLRLIAGNESIEKYAEECGYKTKTFLKALEPFRKTLP